MTGWNRATRFSGALAIGLMAGLFLAACGDDDSDADSSGSKVGTTETAVTTSVVQTVPVQTPPSSVSVPTTVSPPTVPVATSTTTAFAALTTGHVEQYMAEQWPGSNAADRWGVDVGRAWSCEVDTAGGLTTGSVLTCRPEPPVLDGQYPVATVLVLDGSGTGTFAVMESGVVNPILLAGAIVSELGSGLNCTRLTDPSSQLMSGIGSGLTVEERYGGVVLYWFLEGRPSPRMDIDENGIPCETKFDGAVVTTVWSGGWLPRS